jgi:hypothetical protein
LTQHPAQSGVIFGYFDRSERRGMFTVSPLSVCPSRFLTTWCMSERSAIPAIISGST